MAAESTSAPLRFGVAGDPVGHSLSPAIHAAAYSALDIAADYQRLPLPAPLFAETVRALEGSGFRGINVTIPHKRAALDLADSASGAARAIGAANTLSFAHGHIRADNTDAPGMIAALRDEIGARLAGKRALVLGAGGTARAAVWALVGERLEVDVWNRTPSRARALAREFAVNAVGDTSGASKADVIVNATAVGMEASVGEEAALADLSLDLGLVGTDCVVVDFVYRSAGSPLTVAARRRDLRVIDGLELLVRQAALSFEIWFGRPAPLEAMRAAVA